MKMGPGCRTRRITWSLVLIYLVVVKCDQETIDNIAENLGISYNVISNLETNGVTYDAELILDNTGSEPIPDGSTPWQLYFCHIRLIDPDNILHGGSNLGNSGLRVYHVAGCLHKIEPTPDFLGINPSASLRVEILGQYWNIARSDSMPNWYVTDATSQPRVLQSTAGESLDFVGPYDNPEQYKRTPDDTYEPYTAEQRYELRDYGLLSGQLDFQVMPTPAQADLDTASTMHIDSGDWVVVDLSGGSLTNETQFLADKLGTLVVDPSMAPASHYISLNLNTTLSPSLEYYRLLMDTASETASVEGTDAAGVFYGAQSLLSLQEPTGELPHGALRDWPRFQYRGMHADVARHFHGKQDVLQLLEVMAAYKLNKLYLHITDDEGWRLQIPDIDELTQVGARQCHDLSQDDCIMPQLGSGPLPNNAGTGFYTVEDYREILAYATARHIRVLPEFDMPGHAYAAIHAMLARYRKYKDCDPQRATEFLLSDPEDYSEYLSAQYFTDNAINPCVDTVYDFVAHVIDEVMAMHADIQPLTALNFGGDEVPGGAWLNSTACKDKGLLTTEQIKDWFIKNISRVANEAGLDLAAWEDGYNMNTSHIFDRDIFPSDNVYSYAWDNVWEWGGGEMAHVFANDGYKVILSHATHLYYDHPHEPDPEERGYYWATRIVPARKSFGYMPDSIYENIDEDRMGNPLDKGICDGMVSCTPLDPGSEDNIIGIQGHVWSETIRTSDQLHYMVYPRLLALAERAWHKADWESVQDPNDRETQRTQDWQLFANVLGHKELARLDRMGVNYALSPPGARLTSDHRVEVKAEYPGLKIQYSQDAGTSWADHSDTVVMEPGTVQLVTRSADGARMSRPSWLTVPEPVSGGESTCVTRGLLLASVLLACLYT